MSQLVDNRPHKPLMDTETLRDVISLSLWAGQMLLQHGADSKRVEETVHRLGTGLGCDWMDILVSPNAIVASTINNHQFRTKVRRVPSLGVNMHIIAEISDLSYGVMRGQLDRFSLRRELMRIDRLAPNYDRRLVIAAVGLACAAFSRLFGGDWAAFLITFVASAVAMFARQELARHYFNPLLVTAATAFVAGLIASAAALFNLTHQTNIALAASVLLLVPGVPLINSAKDLIQGHLVTGITRGIAGLLISLAIAIGLSLAIWVTGVQGL